MGFKKINVSYYKLKEDKKFSDSSTIETDIILRKLPYKDKLYYLVETIDTYDFKKIFPVKKTDVILNKSVKEKWTEEMIKQQEKEIKSSWVKK